ncbi:MAG: hypothetical protein M3014_00480 [Chloroflexota bacterium]|nr:hypothetical protein [Chloroflexota bacterium]
MNLPRKAGGPEKMVAPTLYAPVPSMPRYMPALPLLSGIGLIAVDTARASAPTSLYGIVSIVMHEGVFAHPVAHAPFSMVRYYASGGPIIGRFRRLLPTRGTETAIYSLPIYA